jgi:hypothetical protein
MLPQSYPKYKTVHRRFQAWCREEILRRVLTNVANELRDRGALDGGALKIGVWFRRGRLLIVSPDSRGTACPLSGRNSTYRPVQISETSSDLGISRLPQVVRCCWNRDSGPMTKFGSSSVICSIEEYLKTGKNQG